MTYGFDQIFFPNIQSKFKGSNPFSLQIPNLTFKNHT